MCIQRRHDRTNKIIQKHSLLDDRNSRKPGNVGYRAYPYAPLSNARSFLVGTGLVTHAQIALRGDTIYSRMKSIPSWLRYRKWCVDGGGQKLGNVGYIETSDTEYDPRIFSSVKIITNQYCDIVRYRSCKKNIVRFWIIDLLDRINWESCLSFHWATWGLASVMNINGVIEKQPISIRSPNIIEFTHNDVPLSKGVKNSP